MLKSITNETLFVKCSNGNQNKMEVGDYFMAKTINTELQRVNINLPTSIVEKVKMYANNLGINVTSAYIVLLNQALEQKEAINQIPLLFSYLGQMQALNNKDFAQSLIASNENNNSK